VERIKVLAITFAVTSKLLQLPATDFVVHSLLIFSILMMEAIRSSETSVPTRATRHHSSEDGILDSHRRGNLKFYKAFTGWTL
jgi:hypothetical protein